MSIVEELEGVVVYLEEQGQDGLVDVASRALRLFRGDPWWEPPDTAWKDGRRLLFACLSIPSLARRGPYKGSLVAYPFVTIGRWVPLAKHPEHRPFPEWAAEKVAAEGGYWGRPGKMIPGTVEMWMSAPELPQFDPDQLVRRPQ